MLIENRTSETG